MYKKILLGVAIVVVVSFIAIRCARTRTPSSGPAALTFYGLADSDVFDPIITRYKSNHPGVTIKYKKFNDPVEFENLLVNEVAEGQGPDIFYLHNTWLPRHIKKLVPLKSDTFTQQKFSETYVNVTADDFIQPDPADGNRKIYALPLYVDTLALYYNKSIYEKKLPEKGKPANNWDALKEDASKLRKQTQDGVLEEGEIALGRADNIRLAADIIYNFFLQSGVDFYNKDFKNAQFAGPGQESFDYFLSFSDKKNKNYSWSADIVPSSSPLKEVEAFLAGKVSAILAYSDLYPALETHLKNVKSRNPSVISLSDIAVMPVPQIATNEADYKVLADYYGLAVSRNSKNAQAAWDFVQFATSQAESKAFHQKTKLPAARRDLIEEQKKEPITDVFVSQVGYAGSYRLFSDVKFRKFMNEAVQNALSGQTSSQALGAAQVKISDLLKLEAPAGLYPMPPIKK
ncbi:extracellular solute-binding protein [Candidatus Peregrinibacteria bacterium]|nr:extracellular solute-binding protein [Candidatus Peregrinibacteria bacterium]